MMNKYYIPEIEEFHVGFEFELSLPTILPGNRLSPSGVWTPYIFGTIEGKGGVEVNPRSMEMFKEGLEFRVKYLDREDIESLGFHLKVIELGEDTEEGHLGLYRGEDHWGTFYLPEANLENVNIELAGSYYLIKNKSELIRLMRQLNIDTK